MGRSHDNEDHRKASKEIVLKMDLDVMSLLFVFRMDKLDFNSILR